MLPDNTSPYYKKKCYGNGGTISAFTVNTDGPSSAPLIAVAFDNE